MVGGHIWKPAVRYTKAKTDRSGRLRIPRDVVFDMVGFLSDVEAAREGPHYGRWGDAFLRVRGRVVGDNEGWRARAGARASRSCLSFER